MPSHSGGKIVADPSSNIVPDGDGFKSLNPEGVSAGHRSRGCSRRIRDM
jgi:hypothetical protein